METKEKKEYLWDEFCIEKEEIVLFGRCYHPTDDPFGRHPAAVICHEFASKMESSARYAPTLCDLGYHVFVFDFTGSKGTRSYGREDIDASILTDKEEMEIVYRYVRDLSHVDKKHIILVGLSQGGLTAGLLAADYKEEIDAVMMYYPALCAPDYLRRGYMMGVQFDPENMPEYIEMYRGTGIGHKYYRDVITLDPWKELTVFKKPVLICHGTTDTIADIAYAREAKRRYEDCTLVEITNGEHIFKVPKNFQIAMDATTAFLKEKALVYEKSK